MVYSNKFVMCLIVDGAIQKELANGTVVIPFGSEYTLRFRNKNNTRAVVKFTIDGENASGNGYVINANSSIDIKRYAHKDCSFKFVSLDSQEAIDYGKNGPNFDKTKGLIEAKFYLEKCNNYYYSYKYANKNWPTSPSTSDVYYNVTCSNNKTYSTCSLPIDLTCSGSKTYNTNASYNMKNTCSSVNLNLNDGATIEGKSTGQNFYETFINTEDDYVCLKLFLQGTNECVENYYATENKNLKKQIEEAKRKMQIDDLIEENKRLKEELNRLKG